MNTFFCTVPRLFTEASLLSQEAQLL
uniref:Uncharacterized protein n=1 Tax=Anguilla anguilla TaxID=7936 RepID=A0A0E9RQL0_ANGAN